MLPYLLSLHVIAMVCWFAGLFYLPRLFVYHAMTDQQAVKEQFKVMEEKLYRYIMMPAMLVTLLTGLGLTWLGLEFPFHFHFGWLGVKLCFVLVLLAFHFYCAWCVQQFKKEWISPGHRFFRYLNELPSLLLVVIVTLAFVKPF